MLPTLSFNRQKSSAQLLVKIEEWLNFSFGILSFLSEQRLWLQKNNSSTWFSLKYLPLEFPPVRFANARMLAENLLADNREFTKHLFWYIELPLKTKKWFQKKLQCLVSN